MRDLHQNACTVAGQRVGAHGPAVLQVEQHCEAVPHDLVAFFTLDVRDKAEAASVVFLGGLIKALCLGKAVGVSQRVTCLHLDAGHSLNLNKTRWSDDLTVVNS